MSQLKSAGKQAESNIVVKQVMSTVLSAGALFAALAAGAGAQPIPTESVIPPIVLQGCAEKVKAGRKSIYASRTFASGSAVGAQTVGFDLSFVNTTQKVAKIVMIRIGGTDFTKIGKFSPEAVVAWRIAAPEGACEVRAVRFEDGTEWSAVASVPSYAAPAAPLPGESPTP